VKSEEHFHRLIDASFLGELTPSRWSALKEHLGTCEACRARYDRTTRLERVLAGGSSGIRQPSPEELDRVQASIFSALGTEARPTLMERFSRWVANPSLQLAAAALGIAFLAFVLPSKEPDEYRARGGAPVRAAGVRAFCLSSAGASPLDSREHQACPISAQLKLALDNPGGYKHVFLVGVQSDAPLWYAPRPPETESALAPEPKEGDVPFGGAIRLEVNHEPGPLRVFALFSDRPLRSTEVEAAIAALTKKGASIREVEALPIDRPDLAQRTVFIEVTP
jgi:hypothetical protein